MALVHAVVQQKGGAGKTTLVANLAAAWAVEHSVAVIDVDPQRSLSRWHALRPARATPITLAEVAAWRLATEIDRLREAHDVVLIDTPGQADLASRVAVRGADLVLLPVQPSLPDLWASDGTVALARDARRRLLVVLNRVGGGARMLAEIRRELAARQLVMATATLGNRSTFPAAFAAGLGVSEASPRSLAAREVLALRREIVALS